MKEGLNIFKPHHLNQPVKTDYFRDGHEFTQESLAAAAANKDLQIPSFDEQSGVGLPEKRLDSLQRRLDHLAEQTVLVEASLHGCKRIRLSLTEAFYALEQGDLLKAKVEITETIQDKELFAAAMLFLPNYYEELMGVAREGITDPETLKHTLQEALVALEEEIHQLDETTASHSNESRVLGNILRHDAAEKQRDQDHKPLAGNN